MFLSSLFFLPFFLSFVLIDFPGDPLGKLGMTVASLPYEVCLCPQYHATCTFSCSNYLRVKRRPNFLAWVHRALNIDMKIFFVPLERIDNNLIWFYLFQRSHSFFKLILRIFFGYILHIFGSEFLSRNQLVSYFAPKAWILVFRSLCGLATCSSTPK